MRTLLAPILGLCLLPFAGCAADSSCGPNLMLQAGICVPIAAIPDVGPGDANADTGTEDSGTLPDGGPVPDTGTPTDAGDAGDAGDTDSATPPDGGTIDSGAPADSGTPDTGAPDAGSSCLGSPCTDNVTHAECCTDAPFCAVNPADGMGVCTITNCLDASVDCPPGYTCLPFAENGFCSPS